MDPRKPRAFGTLLKTAGLFLTISGVAWLSCLGLSSENWWAIHWAWIITLPPALLTLAGILLCHHLNSGLVVVVALGSTGLRLFWAMVANALLGKWAELTGTEKVILAEWTTGFYLFFLTAEVLILWRVLSVADTQGDSESGSG